MKTSILVCALVACASAEARAGTKTRVEKGSTTQTEAQGSQIAVRSNAITNTGGGSRGVSATANGTTDGKFTGGGGGGGGGGGSSSSGGGNSGRPDLQCGKEKCPPGTVPGPDGKPIAGVLMSEAEVQALQRDIQAARRRVAGVALRQKRLRESVRSAANSWGSYNVNKKNWLLNVANTMITPLDHSYALLTRLDYGKKCSLSAKYYDAYIVSKACADRATFEQELEKLDAEVEATQAYVHNNRGNVESGLRSDWYSRGSGRALRWYRCTDDALPCWQAMHRTMDIVEAAQNRIKEVWDNPIWPDPDGEPEPK